MPNLTFDCVQGTAASAYAELQGHMPGGAGGGEGREGEVRGEGQGSGEGGGGGGEVRGGRVR